MTTAHELVDLMARGGREAFFAALGKGGGEPSAGKIEKWSEAAELVHGLCQEEIETTYRTLSEKAYLAYHGDHSRWEQEPRLLQLAWEAVARQMVNLFLAEDGTDLSDCAAFDWKKWLGQKLAGDEHGNHRAEQAEAGDRGKEEE
jgi:hypothetical protein